MKKIIAVVLVLLFAAASNPAAVAADFSDVPQDHWAISYIREMTERGLFTGFPDGTFRPDAKITLNETLVLLSRLYEVDEESKQELANENNSYLAGLLNGTGMSWAIPELAICLEAGIITKVELNGYVTSGELGKPVTKELLSVFLVRALQLEDEVQSLTNYTLPFDDYLFITYTRRPYVYMLYTIQVVGGDTYNRFNPNDSVNRAVSATMLSRAITYLKNNNITLRLTRFSETRTIGILAEAAPGSILLLSYDGSETRVTVPASAHMKVNGTTAALSSAYNGYPATFVWSKDDNSLRGIEIDTSVKAAYGALKSIDTMTSTPKIYLTDLLTAVTTGYNLGGLATADYEGSTVNLASLTVGSYVTVLLKNDAVTSIHAFKGSYEKTGTIKSVNLGSPIILTVSVSGVTESEIKMNPKSLPVVTRNNALSSVDKLRIGDTVKITVKNSVITQIDAASEKQTLTGTIKSIIKDVTGNRLTLIGDNGTEYSYPLAAGVQIRQGAVYISLDSLRLGSKAGIVISDSRIESIDVTEATTAISRLTGSLLFVNTRDQTMILQIKNEDGITADITVKLMALTKILNASNGSIVNLSTLEIYDELDIYGAYNAESVFEATIIITR